ncbi:MAG: FAD-dependent monooxygenase [Ahrensia sp.]|nr:FAD-dependent monooxygenase [Ahrensia sp.]
MQYHLNGFTPGDPSISHPEERPEFCRDKVDVAIVGCGPAGLTLAAQLAAIGDLNIRIFDRKAGPLEVGQADGIACRSMEMFEAFGFVEKVLKESYWVNETSFWRPGAENRTIRRADRIQDVEDDLSHQPHVILNQARVHDFYLEMMKNSPSRLEPDYERELISLVRTGDPDYPSIAVFDCLDKPGQQETVYAKYVVGCDGARSTVRKSMGYELRGEAARQLWGVMDVLATTDFPDIRLKSAIQSADAGSILIIPREGGYLVRLYIELDELHGNERASDRKVSPEFLEEKAQAILSPYKFEVKQVAWWSAYEIGQRVCDGFDDVAGSERANKSPHIFIAGDACHTHSPKAGQGMNVSMADTFNLGWKLASVLKGQAKPNLLNTYSEERQAKARELIEFDRDMARLFIKKPSTEEEEAEFQRYFQKHGRYTAGVETTYDSSLIVGSDVHQAHACGLRVGQRFHSAPVIRLADAKPMQLAETLRADGRWRLIAFADERDHGQENGAISNLCRFLETSTQSPLAKYTHESAESDSMIETLAVFQRSHRELDLSQMPKLLLPRKGVFQLTDYEKIFTPDFEGGADIFHMRNINRSTGALAVIRPDQFIAQILPLTEFATLEKFFSGFMKSSDPTTCEFEKLAC